MALITSAASGNFSAGATWTGGVVPGVGDEARASTGHTITVDVNTTCDEVSNAGTGKFVLANGVTLTANVTHKGTTNATNCVELASTNSATVIGNITGGAAFARVGCSNLGTGTLTITGNCLGGSDAAAVNNASTGIVSITGTCTGGTAGTAPAANNASTGTVNITGTCTGGSGTGIGTPAANNAAGGTINITGNVTGGTTASAHGTRNASTGTMTITGIVTGGSVATCYGVTNISTGTVNIVGTAVGAENATAGIGAHNASTGGINITRAKGNSYGPGNSSGLSSAAGATNIGLGVIEIEELEFGAYGQSPTVGTGIRLKKVSSNVAVFNYVDSGSAKTLVDATQGQMPAASDVRDGVSYASGALTGSCKVPAAASVAYGVPVDATTGTAYLSQSDVLAAVWGAATSSLTTAGSIGERLKNASTVATNSDQLAAALTAP